MGTFGTKDSRRTEGLTRTNDMCNEQLLSEARESTHSERAVGYLTRNVETNTIMFLQKSLDRVAWLGERLPLHLGY